MHTIRYVKAAWLDREKGKEEERGICFSLSEDEQYDSMYQKLLCEWVVLP